MKSPDDNELAILGKLPADPKSGARLLTDVPRLLTAHELLTGSLRRAELRKPGAACTTGNRFLDAMTGGLLPGWCWLLGAQTNWGKTMWAIAVADDNLAAGRGVLIVSLEDPEELYADRLMLRRCCVRSRDGMGGVVVDADHLRLGQLTAAELSAMRDVANAAERKPVFLDARSMKGERIAQEIGRVLDNVPIDLVILDYLQEVASERQHQSTRDQVREMARCIRQEVKSRQRALIMVSQVTMGEDPDKWPRMNQIRDSRDVVNAAEVVLMAGTATADVAGKDGSITIAAGERGVKIEKVKQGRKGLVKLPWDDTAACFLPVRDTSSDAVAARYAETEQFDDYDDDGARM